MDDVALSRVAKQLLKEVRVKDTSINLGGGEMFSEISKLLFKK